MMAQRPFDPFGPTFVIEEMDDLELLTDLLFWDGDYLGVLLAVASWIQNPSRGMNHVGPIAMERLSRARRETARHNSTAVPPDNGQLIVKPMAAAYQADLLQV